LRYKIRGESYKNPGEGIMKIADDERVDMIIMGSRGLGAVKRIFIGSVSEYIVRRSTVPTLIIPSKKKT
jgi:nucleotide-binding universal stress UspA family protein